MDPAMELKPVNSDYCVCGQIDPGDVAQAAAKGIRTIINCRPDNEVEGQVSSADLEAAAQAAGIQYHHVPMKPGQLEPGVVARYTRAMGGVDRPVLGFCRTGKRAMILWAVANPHELDVEQRLSAASAGGFDLSNLQPLMAQT